jgi:hypothetical protein
MGHSIQVVGDRTEIIEDAELEVVLHLLIESATASPGSYRALEPFVVEWEQEITASGAGCMDVGLDRIVSNPAALADLERLMANVEQDLAGFGTEIPAAVLNGYGRTSTRFVGAYPTRHVVSTMERLRTLVR